MKTIWSEVGDRFLWTKVREILPLPIRKFSPQARWRNEVYRAVVSSGSVTKIHPIGSWAHGTAIAGYSDWDYLVLANIDDAHDSADDALQTLLGNTRHCVDKNVEVELDHPAVRITDPFNGGFLDLVPAKLIDGSDYLIPNPFGEAWVRTNPSGHTAYVSKATRANAAIRYLIMLVKLWKYSNSTPLSSLYLELVVCENASRVGHDDLLQGLIRVFQILAHSKLNEILDPSVSAEQMVRAYDDFQSDVILRASVETALNVLLRADAATRSGANLQVDEYLSSLFPRRAPRILNTRASVDQHRNRWKSASAAPRWGARKR